MTKAELKRRFSEAVDRRADEIIGVGERIRRHPELGVKDNAVALVGADEYREVGHRTGSTDMGDLSQIIPVPHPYMAARGSGHAADYEIEDTALAYVAPAKALASMVVDMLGAGAAGAREVPAKAKARLRKDAYLALQRGMARREVYAGAE